MHKAGSMGRYEDYNSPDTKLVSVRIRMDLFTKIDKIADETGRTRSAIVNALLAKSLKMESQDRVGMLENEVARLSEDLHALRREVKKLSRNSHPINIDEA